MSVTLPGDGAVVATVEVEGALQQVVHVANLPAIQPVTVDALPLPGGAATETTIAALLTAANAIKAAAETLAGRTINTAAIGGTVALDAASLAALENVTVGGTVAVSNLPSVQTIAGTVAVSNLAGLTDTQLRAAAVPVTVENMSAGLTDAQLRAAPVPVAVSITKNTDTPFTNGDPGLLMLAKRRDSDTTSVSADGDYTTLNMDETGRLKVSTLPGSTTPAIGSITANAQRVFINVERVSTITISMAAASLVGHNATFEYSNNSTNGTDGNWYGVQVVRSNANTVETATGVLAATPGYGWEASVNAYKWFCVRATAHTSGTAAYILQPGAYATEPIPASQITGTQPVSGTVTVASTTVTASTPATPTASNINSAATTNATLVKASAGTLYNIGASNTGGAAAFIKLYNKATAPTVGTDVPVLVLVVPAGGNVDFDLGPMGHRFATGIGLAITNLAADTDTTAVAAAQVKVLTSFI